MKVKIIAAALALTPAIGLADSYSNQFYLGGDIGRTVYKGFEGSTAFSVSLGYSFNQNFNIEASFTEFGDKSNSTTIQGAFLYPLNHNFDIFVQLGISSVGIEKDSNRYDQIDPNYQVLVAGLGLKYNLNNTLDLRAAYSIHDDGILVPHVGVLVKF